MLVHDRPLVQCDDSFGRRLAGAQNTVPSLRVINFSPFFDGNCATFRVWEIGRALVFRRTTVSLQDGFEGLPSRGTRWLRLTLAFNT